MFAKSQKSVSLDMASIYQKDVVIEKFYAKILNLVSETKFNDKKFPKTYSLRYSIGSACIMSRIFHAMVSAVTAMMRNKPTI